MTGLQALRDALRAALAASPRLRVVGEAVGLSPVTAGLAADFPDRVHALPASDATLVGVALGMAMNGDTVVVELAGPEGLPAALAALDAAESSREAPLRVVVRVPLAPGGAAAVAAALSSQRAVAVRAIGQAGDAAAQLQAALADGGPSLLLEPLAVLGRPASPLAPIDAGAPRLLREGDHATVVAFGETVPAALQAADALAADDITIDVLDLRVLEAADGAALGQRLRHTGRPILAVQVGHGRLLDRVNGHAFLRLEAPPTGTGPSADAIARSVRSAVHY